MKTFLTRERNKSMPYLKREQRSALDNGAAPSTAGALNFAITMLCKEYLGTGFNYQRLNDIIGALEGAKMEFYRRIAVPYEDCKLAENGDVYGNP